MLIRQERRLPAQWTNRCRVAGLLMLVFTTAALLGTEPLKAQEKTGRAKAKSSTDAGQSADAVPVAIRREIATLKQAGNCRGLAAKLKDNSPAVRRQAALALQQIVQRVSSSAELKQLLPPLVAATLNDSSPQVRQHARFALRDVLSRVEDDAALIPVAQSFLAGLNHKDATMRTCYAHTLYENVSKIENKTVLVQMVRPLTAAALIVGDSGDGGLKAPDLAYMALKQVLDVVDDQAALKSIVLPMAEALKADEAKRRSHAAHAVMLFAHKVKDKAALWPLVQPLVTAHFHDPDPTARRCAGLALERTFGRMPEPN
jgi:HEAT repeat protein